MSRLTSRPSRARSVAFVPDWRERRHWQPSALVVRSVQAAAGIAVLLLPAGHHLIFEVILLIGLVTAVVSPARNGPGLAMIGGLASWVVGDGTYHHPPVERVLPFAFALFVLWSATALAAAAPLDCIVRPELVRHWLRQSALGLLVAAVLIGLVYAIGAVTTGRSTPVLEFAGALGVLLVVAVAAVIVARTLREGPDADPPSSNGRRS
ncbi:MAG TPA: hypothetical protein VHO01_09150 [Jatrophihabitans sp.]|nr:hypothetical protein [Jatrophihabitans sp.]